MKDFRARLRNLDKRGWYLILGIMVLLFPVIVRSDRWVQVANFFFIYAMLGLSLNIILGYAGLFQLGHAAFYAVGAYTTAILSTHFGVPIFVALPISGLLAAIFAILISRPILHLRGDYLCIVTIGFGEIVRIALRNDVSSLVFLAKIPGLALLKEKLTTMVITGGPNGIMGIARPRILGFVFRQQWHYFYLFLAFVAFTIFAMRRLENSRLGRAWTCVREDELAAEAMGIDTVRVKLLAFAIGAAWAGVAGSLYASWVTVIAPESFSFWESVIMFCIVVLGGTGSIPGVLVGTIGMVVLPELLREVLLNIQQWRMLIFGAAMIFMMVVRPEGLWPSQRFRRELELAREMAVPGS
ncbi:MAG: branched-chain amino acid ABC transporter permease [Anaerolineae bacterium]|jgi:branched-chain amino acid transport system permease protein|nr:branched-chain amino acid ABC transporter permease [Anaerolineae bacterium]MDH7475122.1 branched-chain amino acid ABC transporter permease [Anaerolineae bacterium]